MASFDSAYIATHIVYRTEPPHTIVPGPFTAVSESIVQLIPEVYLFQTPLVGYEYPVRAGSQSDPKNFYIPRLLGVSTFIKYFLDFLLGFIFFIQYLIQTKGKKRVVIGIDPLCCLPLIPLKFISNFSLVFYCVDFNWTRFHSSLLQWSYKKADEICSRFSDQVWVVGPSLADYKKMKYSVNSEYIPNSPIFREEIYRTGKKYKKGNKLIWGGSCLTERQYDILFDVLKKIQSVRPDLEITLAPTDALERYKKSVISSKLKNTKVLKLSREEWQKYIARCDVGLAVYDEQAGSTAFIEPLKIWEFMMGGTPFIISGEIILSMDTQNSGVAYRLAPYNTIPNTDSLLSFLDPKNLAKLEDSCVRIAKKYDMKSRIKQSLEKLG